MNEKVVTAATSFHINTKNVRLAHKPDEVGEAWMYTYIYDGNYIPVQKVHMKGITLEQLELLQRMQLECARQLLNTDGGEL